MSNGLSSGTPNGWRRVSDYCIARDDWTICKVWVNGWRYELWQGKNQLAVGMSTAAEAIREYSRRTTSNNSAPAPGPKSSPSPDGAPAAQLSFLEAS
jgi:hypothetical protein